MAEQFSVSFCLLLGTGAQSDPIVSVMRAALVLLTAFTFAQGFVPSSPAIRTIRPRPHVRLASQRNDAEDLVDRSTNFLSRSIKGLQKEINVPASVVPPRIREQDKKTTSITAGWVFASGVSLALGNWFYPVFFYGSLYVSRPTDSPDWAAAAVAALASSIIKPVYDNLIETFALEGINLGGLGILGGTLIATVVLASVLKEGDAVFYKSDEENVTIKGLKEQRDINFMDSKLKSKDRDSQ